MSFPCFAGVAPGYDLHFVANGKCTYHQLAAIQAFYALTPGSENLLPRTKCLAALLATGQAALAMVHNGSDIVAAGALLPQGDTDEISAMLVAPNHRGVGLDTVVRDALKTLGKGRPQVMFERFPDDARAALTAKRKAEGWRVLPFSNPLYQRIESTKPKSGNPAPKTGFIRATGGTVLAFPLHYAPGRNHRRPYAPTVFR